MHIWWASNSATFLLDKTIRPASSFVEYFLIFIMFIIALYFWMRKEVTIALLSVVGLSFVCLVASITGIIIGSIYLPIFNPIYAIFIASIIGLFTRIAVENFGYAAALTKNQHLEAVSDMKFNFLALMSHNLNTPVAKIQGLIDLITSEYQISQEHQQWHDSLRRLACIMQLYVRVVLTTASIDSGGSANSAQNIMRLIERLENDFSLLCRGLNLSINFEISDDDRDETWMFQPYEIDSKLLGYVLIVAMELNSGELQLGKSYNIVFTRSRDEEDETLILTLDKMDLVIAELISTHINQGANDTPPHSGHPQHSYFELKTKVAANFLQTFGRHHNAESRLINLAQQTCTLELTLRKMLSPEEAYKNGDLS
jgi:signal transduction histidine kinase